MTNSFEQFTLPTDVELPKPPTNNGKKNFTISDSGVYKAKIELAYLRKSNGGAAGLDLTFLLDNGRTFKETIWISTRDDTGNKTTYTDRKTKKEVPLMGYMLVNDLTNITINKSLDKLKFTKKAIKLWDFQQKAEKMQEVDLAMELEDKTVYLALFKDNVNKGFTNPQGKWEHLPETRFTNSIAHIFSDPDKFTYAEIQNKSKKPNRYNSWIDRNEGVVRDKREYDPSQGANGSNPNSGSAFQDNASQTVIQGQPGASEKSQEKKSLFDD